MYKIEERRIELNTLGHTKPKKNSENCLYYLADKYKIKKKSLKKKELIEIIIKHEIEHNIQFDININNQYTERILNTFNKSLLEKICKDLNLSFNGSKRFLIERIIEFQQTGKKLKLKEQIFIEKTRIEHSVNGYINYNLDQTINQVILPDLVITNSIIPYDYVNNIYYPEHVLNTLHFALHIKILHEHNLHLQLNATIVQLYENEIKFLNDIFSKLNINIHINSISYNDHIEEAVNIKYTKKDVTNITSKFESKTYKGDDNKEQCTVCLENIKKGEKITKLDCKHMFHTDCINEWISRDNTCPCCRVSL
jgi:hypothetical protein